MEIRPNRSAETAQAKLILQLCEALSTFVAGNMVDQKSARGVSAEAANDNVLSGGTIAALRDVISLKGILAEFGLTPQQVLKLRKEWGFPEPIGLARPMMFRRNEVERWARSQPNRKNLGTVLRSRKRRP